ncbi:MAG: hypothetical protein B6240_11385 [Desulfobacteraceae bacterium 4572_87]|nr:MAG: hypothetical protein B6240_11385 [Desulfobacteraceae bacterium 4572_87]
MAFRFKTICLTLTLLLFIPVATPAAEKSLIFYILDGSGSMWGRVDGKIKIQVAKEVMTTLLKETPEGIDCGIMVYGHRKKGDCADIEMIVPIGPLQKETAIGKINRISPKGKTPISASISMAVDQVKGSEAVSTIVLVSDGIETCGNDPCDVVKKLKGSGINFVMHVVGFNVKADAAKQLACIAEAGGGNYFSTTNATDLLSAMNQIKESVVEKKEIDPPAPTPEPKAITQEVSKKATSIRIKAKGPGTVKLKYDSWLKPPRYWKLVDPETGEEKGRFQGLGDQLVPPGEYQIVWRQSEHNHGEVTLGEVMAAGRARFQHAHPRESEHPAGQAERHRTHHGPEPGSRGLGPGETAVLGASRCENRQTGGPFQVGLITPAGPIGNLPVHLQEK